MFSKSATDFGKLAPPAKTAFRILVCDHLNAEANAEFKRELEVMVGLRSPQIIEVYGAVLQGKQLSNEYKLKNRKTNLDLP